MPPIYPRKNDRVSLTLTSVKILCPSFTNKGLCYTWNIKWFGTFPADLFYRFVSIKSRFTRFCYSIVYLKIISLWVAVHRISIGTLSAWSKKKKKKTKWINCLSNLENFSHTYRIVARIFLRDGFFRAWREVLSPSYILSNLFLEWGKFIDNEYSGFPKRA